MLTFFSTNPQVARGMASYNDALTRENMARMETDAARYSAELHARAQQQAQENATRQFFAQQQMAQQQAAQDAAYRNAVLENQRAQTAAQMDWAKALSQNQVAEAQKDRESRERIAGLGALRNAPSAADIQGANNEAEAEASRRNFQIKSLKEQQAAEEEAAKSEYAQNLARISPLTTDAGWKAQYDKKLAEINGRYRKMLSDIVGGVPKEAPLTFDPVNNQFVPKLFSMPTNSPAGIQAPQVAPQQAPAAPAVVPQSAPMMAPAPQASTNAPAVATPFFGQATNAPSLSVTNPRVVPVTEPPLNVAPSNRFFRPGEVPASAPSVLASATALSPAPADPAQRQIGAWYQSASGPVQWTGSGWLQ